MEKQKPFHGRLGHSGSLKPVIDRLALAYGIGTVSTFGIIEVGYEDCNVAIETSTSKYVAKIFSKGRTADDISRYTKTMEMVMNAGVNHPPVIRTAEGKFVHKDLQASGISMVLMEFIEGKTFFELDRAPDSRELGIILEQASKINKIDYHPPYIFDTWAIPNIKAMFERVSKFIAQEDKPLIDEAISRYNKIPVDSLPHCFVHGDFTKANILKAKDGRIFILDFSVSNWYPRIQELAVITANLLYRKTDSTTLQEKCNMVGSSYSKLNPLTKDEMRYLPDYALAGMAMEFMGAHQEKYINGNDSEETGYWLNLGRQGLKKALRM